MEALITNLVTAAFGVIALYLTPRIAAWLAAQAERMHIQISLVQRQQLEAFIMQQILAQKEAAADAIKRGIRPLQGGEKLEAVIASTVDKFPGIDEEEAEQLTKSLLASVGEGATMVNNAAFGDLLTGMVGGTKQ